MSPYFLAEKFCFNRLPYAIDYISIRRTNSFCHFHFKFQSRGFIFQINSYGFNFNKNLLFYFSILGKICHSKTCLFVWSQVVEKEKRKIKFERLSPLTFSFQFSFPSQNSYFKHNLKHTQNEREINFTYGRI